MGTARSTSKKSKGAGHANGNRKAGYRKPSGGGKGSVSLDDHPLGELHRSVGNEAVGAILHRRSDKTAKTAKAAHKPTEADLNGDAAVLAMHVSMVLGSPGYGPDSAVGLPDRHIGFLKHLYRLVHDKPFGPADGQYVTGVDREADLIFVQTMMPVIAMELARDPEGKQQIKQIDRKVAGVTQLVTRNAVYARAEKDATLGAQLISRPVAEARATAIEVLRKTAGITDKVLATAGGVVSESGGLSAAGNDVKSGLGSLIKVLKTTDPAEYRKSVDEASEWCAQHGMVLGTIKGVQVIAEITDLTAGTAVAVGKTLTDAAMKFLGPTGANLELLADLQKEGMLISKANQAALTFGKVGSFLDKADSVLSVVSIVGNTAKLITADSMFDRVDAGVSVTSSSLSLAAKVTGRAAWGTAAVAITLPWEFTKFVMYLGELGGGAVEGSMYGGLWEELREIEHKGDQVSHDMVVLARILDERDARFAGAEPGNRQLAGADEAASDAAYRLQKSLGEADRRWRESSIEALSKAYPSDVQSSVMWSKQEEYPPDLVASSAGEFLASLTGAYKNAAEIVLQMAVDQGYFTEAEAAGKLKDMRKKAAAG